MTPVRVPRGCGVFEMVEKRSKFIGALFPADGEQCAVELLNGVRARHREATHNVYAYRLTEGQHARYSDDGEPQGTAGMPVLEVLRREEVTNVLCVVTRYFGGTLLGAGGLVRAYAAAAKGALDAAGISVLVPLAPGETVLEYIWWEQARRLLRDIGAQITDTHYADTVTVRFELPDELRAELAAGLGELTGGRASISWLGTKLGTPPQTD